MSRPISQSEFESICEDVLRREYPSITKYSFKPMQLIIHYPSNTGNTERISSIEFTEDCSRFVIDDMYHTGVPLHVGRSIRSMAQELY